MTKEKKKDGKLIPSRLTIWGGLVQRTLGELTEVIYLRRGDKLGDLSQVIDLSSSEVIYLYE